MKRIIAFKEIPFDKRSIEAMTELFTSHISSIEKVESTSSLFLVYFINAESAQECLSILNEKKVFNLLKYYLAFRFRCKSKRRGLQGQST